MRDFDMVMDVQGIVRVVIGYSKIPDADGELHLEVEYRLKPLNLEFLQKLYNISPNDPDYGVRDLIDCYPINAEQAKTLQPYVIDGVIDLEKYDFMLECYQI
ncbi:DUF7683 domain-containing protein [Candidatus Berkiella aquae]|uniref:DUF7683 domain-containing protein n=2 Tax=Candidatus Berkiella aquae TaxID=295108 RepID=A0AAE3HYX9_9GAMM|nr:hypothetical protein [Candidatus Berkiella aquae]MCS5712149.1 hypothetical protein [Candidatus Berkiella aquae]